jgi:hypothetical protein
MPSPYHREDPPNDDGESIVDKAMGVAKAAFQAVMGGHDTSFASGVTSKRKHKKQLEKAAKENLD